MEKDFYYEQALEKALQSDEKKKEEIAIALFNINHSNTSTSFINIQNGKVFWAHCDYYGSELVASIDEIDEFIKFQAEDWELFEIILNGTVTIDGVSKNKIEKLTETPE